ncbi:hypothetical protein BKI52_14915 [marine bacterium AO1-C]|nr:hypothetical protein BKI52_14915 [marine bacterium AO1-C]
MNSLNWFEILMLFGALQGVLLIVAINRFSKRQKAANQIFTAFLISIVFNSSWEIWRSSGEMIVMDGIRNAIFFLYGPFYYCCVQSLLTTQLIDKKKWLIHTVPSLIYSGLLFFMIQNPGLWRASQVLTVVLVLVHGILYLWKSYQLVVNYRKKTLNTYPHLKYLQTITMLAGLFLLASLVALLIVDTAYFVVLFNRYLTGLIGSFVIYSLAYFAVLFPEVFKLPIEKAETKDDTPAPTPEVIQVPSKPRFKGDELQIWKTKLEEVMNSSKLYLNPTLALNDIANEMKIDKLLVSRVINEGYQLNFYDFVNTYRVEHFIQLSQDKQYQHYTTLALAYEAGFNAKSTFHKVFKKIKNTTPTAYLKLINEKPFGASA